MRHRSWSRTALLLGLASTAFAVGGCAKSGAPATDNILTVCPAPSEPEEAALVVPELQNIVLMIGDGMGPQQIGLLELYARYAGDPRYPEGVSHIGRMIRDGTTGLVMSTPSNGLVNDSSAGATQIGTGALTTFGATGLDMDGHPVQSALVVAKERGMATGLVSDTRLTHATPASFAAHIADRWDETTIATQMLETAPDLMFSGGWRYFLPQGIAKNSAQKAQIADRFELPPEDVVSVRKDDRNLLEEAASAGYRIITHPAALEDLNTLPALGLFAPNGMQTGTEWWVDKHSESPAQPSLEQMTLRALSLLEAKASGLFLMVEGGQIDWAGHNNQAQRLLYEMLRFDATVGAVLDWAADRDDTLVIVTADHETGGFSIHYDKNGPPNASLFDTLDSSPNYVSWATTAHTHTPVLATAYGHQTFTSPFAGIYHQSQLGQIILEWVGSVTPLTPPTTD